MSKLSISPKSKKLLDEDATYKNGLKASDTIRIAKKIAMFSLFINSPRQ